ncbi:flagellar hook-associated protein FlgL [Celerinatantimonas sp. YJH-8]|uniref:flagellar hook-associated protein FlgL n=1 Tax=Celerinatantimonas sp. YJH-8 TaxID=3228714 RepID=UPI0038CB24CA
MRVATANLYNTSMNGILNAQQKVEESNHRLVTNKRLLVAGDGPSDMSKKMSYDTDIDQNAQYQKNGVSLENALSYQESILNSMHGSALRARVLGVQAGDGLNGMSERQSMAKELSQVRSQMADLVNTRDANGNYIFAGFQTQIQPYVFDGNQYHYVGDNGKTKLKVSSSVYIQNNTTGKDAFEDVELRRKANGNSSGIYVAVKEQRTFDTFFQNNYDDVNTSNNNYTITTTASEPPQYTIFNNAGEQLASGQYQQSEPFEFKGLKIKLDSAPGTTETFTLEKPRKDNILNILGEFINKLNDPNVIGKDFDKAQEDFLVGIDHATDKLNLTMGSLGARGNGLDSLREASSSIDVLNKKARASVGEVDFSQAVTQLSKAELALNTSYSAYSKISKMTLFNYI